MTKYYMIMKDGENIELTRRQYDEALPPMLDNDRFIRFENEKGIEYINSDEIHSLCMRSDK